MRVWSAEPGTPAHDALRILASWSEGRQNSGLGPATGPAPRPGNDPHL